MHIKDPHIMSRKLGSVLDKCSTWLVNNKLSLHLGKTECILFRPKRKLSDFKDFSIVFNNHVIKSADNVKYLGVIIENCLSGDYIVDSIEQKVNSRLKFLYRQARFLDLKCKCLYVLLLYSVILTMHLVLGTRVYQNVSNKNFKGPITIRRTPLPTFLVNFSTFAFLLNFSFMK